MSLTKMAVETIIHSLIAEMQGDYINANLPSYLGKAMTKSKKEEILNKGQNI